MKLKITDLTKKFAEQKALDALDLELSEVSSLVLVGPSGSGKTTLLRILAGLEIPDSGRVQINQRQLKFQEQELLKYRKEIGVVFQAFNLFPHWTARENIILPLIKVHKYSPREAEQRAEKLLKRFALQAHKNKKPYQLSGGQQQRIALCRAAALKPEILLLDEPTSALDPELTTEVLELIAELKSEGIEFILVTHEMGFAAEAAEIVVFMDEGKIIDFGSPQQILHGQQRQPRIKEFMDKILKYEHNL
ncbi:MAG: amino acid ABC transporter ATP-binding protein [Candidatus Cloacimonadales bacterium]